MHHPQLLLIPPALPAHTHATLSCVPYHPQTAAWPRRVVLCVLCPPPPSKLHDAGASLPSPRSTIAHNPHRAAMDEGVAGPHAVSGATGGAGPGPSAGAAAAAAAAQPSTAATYQTVFTNAKAGMEGVDKEHVKRVVYEMSKVGAERPRPPRARPRPRPRRRPLPPTPGPGLQQQLRSSVCDGAVHTGRRLIRPRVGLGPLQERGPQAGKRGRAH